MEKVKMKTSYQALLSQIKKAKQHLDTLPRCSFAYRDYKKFYDKLCAERQKFKALLNGEEYVK